MMVTGADNGDEVARQRRKRAAALLDRSVPDFDDVTLNDVVRSVMAASDEAKEPLDVERFLTERGHAWQTVDMVRVCLTFVGPHPAFPPTDPLW